VADLFERHLDNIELLPEGAGDGESVDAEGSLDDEDGGDESGSGGEEESSGEEQFVDESNPFYSGKKAGPAHEAGPAKPAYKDSSDAASDILKKMLDRRRASRS
jgi:hypothetical protein